MMKKVGIITINDNTNIGNRLQNYATNEFLMQQGLYAENIVNFSKFNENSNGLKNMIHILKEFICSQKKYKRRKKFEKFNYDYIKNSKYVLNRKCNLFKLNNHYDYFLVGSDQVWNYKFGWATDNDFLTFANKEKRISFAASFGINEISNDLKEYYKKNLEQFKAISVREERGKEIIKELTGRKDTVVLLDPTMLIPIERWNDVMKKPKMLDKLHGKKYILEYFLGNLSENRKKEIKRISKESNCEIIDILDEKSPFYLCGPSEFVYLEKNAFLICTDSFHSTVFAILFNRPFVVFDREDKEVKMNSRLETLLNKFGLNNRWFENKIDIQMLKANYEINSILENERKKAQNFIENAIK